MVLDEKAKQIALLINRLERLSADSIWAHRACGIRGSLIEYLENNDGTTTEKFSDYLESIIEQGYLILEQAVKLSFSYTRIKGKNAGDSNMFA